MKVVGYLNKGLGSFWMKLISNGLSFYRAEQLMQTRLDLTGMAGKCPYRDEKVVSDCCRLYQTCYEHDDLKVQSNHSRENCTCSPAHSPRSRQASSAGWSERTSIVRPPLHKLSIILAAKLYALEGTAVLCATLQYVIAAGSS